MQITSYSKLTPDLEKLKVKLKSHPYWKVDTFGHGGIWVKVDTIGISPVYDRLLIHGIAVSTTSVSPACYLGVDNQLIPVTENQFKFFRHLIGCKIDSK